MKLTRLNRNREILPANIINFMDEVFGNDNMMPFDNGWSTYQPKVNVSETKDNYKIELAAPGLSKSDFNVSLEKNILTISAEKKIESTNGDEKFARREFNFTSFDRSFFVPETVMGDNISANYVDGVLNVKLPKKEEAKDKPAMDIKIS